MKRTAVAILVAGSLAFATAPAVGAQPDHPIQPDHPTKPSDVPTQPDHPTGPSDVPTQPDHATGPKPGLPAKAKAYGKYCQDQSKKHVEGVKGTPFSACVTAMAKVAKTDADGGNAAPRGACKDLSKKQVKGEKGTAFSKCVVGAQELKRELRETETA